MSSGSSIYGVLSYNQLKVDDQHAKVVLTNRMIEPRDGIYDINICMRSFEPYLLANNRTEKPVLHISLNPDPKDVLTDEQLSGIAQEYMDKMGYGNQPFIVYKHEDIDRHHLHIVSLRVDENGAKLDHNFEHRRSMKVCRELEEKYNLAPATKKQWQEGTPLKPVDYDKGDVKHQIANVIRPVVNGYHFQSFKEYRAMLSLYNINVEEVKGEVKGKIYQGLVYSALNDKGEKVGNPFKSSLFGKSVGFNAIEKRCEQSKEIISEKNLREPTKHAVAKVLRTTGNRADFEKELAKVGISVLMRENKEGRIYGVTFIDHNTKCVLNGSRLGKEFSANVINGLDSPPAKAEKHLQPDNAAHSFEPTPTAQQESDNVIDGVAGIFSTEIHGTDPEEERFIRRMKKKRRKI